MGDVMPEVNVIAEEARRIAESGALGRSRSYVRLLEYLVQCSERGMRPKELEIAADVFNKGSGFDPSQDAFVRVYVHNLRQKIEKYYAARPAGDGGRLVIPRGEYRLTVAAADRPAKARPAWSAPPMWTGAVAVLLLANLVAMIAWRFGPSVSDPLREVARSPLWAELLNDDLPLLVVVGDYFIFAELDEFGTVHRLVREFDVNSGGDLDDLFVNDPDLLASYMDLDLTYLPQGSASALSELLRVVYAGGKDVRVTTMTETRVADLKDQHILYVGYVSALGTLMDFVFAASGLRVGASFDELRDVRTGQTYTSGAGIPGAGDYEDYGLVSTFPGPDGNQFLIVAGTRDSGLMHAAQAITSLRDLRQLDDVMNPARAGDPASVGGPASTGAPPAGNDAAPAFEALYEVTGFDRINLDATLVYKAPLDHRPIWGAEVAGIQH